MRFFSVLILILCTKLYSISDVEQLISKASTHNTYFLYEDAIKLLNEAIKRDPYEKEAYKERAFSYFELNRIDLALEDYRLAIDPKPSNRTHFQNYALGIHSFTLGKVPPSLEFAKGLLYGTMLGGREGTIDFASSVRGGLTFLWSFACSPIDVSKELIEALYDMGKFFWHLEELIFFYKKHYQSFLNAENIGILGLNTQKDKSLVLLLENTVF